MRTEGNIPTGPVMKGVIIRHRFTLAVSRGAARAGASNKSGSCFFHHLHLEDCAASSLNLQKAAPTIMWPRRRSAMCYQKNLTSSLSTNSLLSHLKVTFMHRGSLKKKRGVHRRRSSSKRGMLVGFEKENKSVHIWTVTSIPFCRMAPKNKPAAVGLCRTPILQSQIHN